MIPQADSRWFVSQVAWTAFFFVVQFLLSKYLIFKLPEKNKLHRKVMADLMSKKISSLNEDLSLLKARRADIEANQRDELDLIKFEVVAQSQAELDDAVKQVHKRYSDKKDAILSQLIHSKKEISKNKPLMQNLAKKLCTKAKGEA